MLLASSLPIHVVDASVAVKWHLRDEPDTDAADALLTDFREGRVELVAPGQIRYEVPSAIRNALRTGRLTPTQGTAAVADFLAWQIPTVDDAALVENGFDWAVRIGCSFYDGVDLALAESIGHPFVYADQRLRNALGGRFPLALWLNDYVPPG